MKTYRDEAVVLRGRKLGEADRILTLLTRYHGQVSAVAKGVRRTSSKFGARLEQFSVIDVQLYRGRNLETVTQVETLAHHGRVLMSDYSAFTVAHAMAETAENLTRAQGLPATQQYRLLVGGLGSLARQEHAYGLILDSYLLRALAYAGWAPSFTDCAKCGAPGPHRSFAASLGGMVCEQCRIPGSARVSPAAVTLLAALRSGDWAIADQSTEAVQKECAGLVANFSQYHLERHLRSLALVERNPAAHPIADSTASLISATKQRIAGDD